MHEREIWFEVFLIVFVFWSILSRDDLFLSMFVHLLQSV